MSHIRCPFCGDRALREFEFRKTLPGSAATPLQSVYFRQDHPQVSVEHWQHQSGCRSWLLIVRNPSTGSILRTDLLPEFPT